MGANFRTESSSLRARELNRPEMKSTATRTAADQSATRASRRPPGVAKTGGSEDGEDRDQKQKESGHKFVEAATKEIQHDFFPVIEEGASLLAGCSGVQGGAGVGRRLRFAPTLPR